MGRLQKKIIRRNNHKLIEAVNIEALIAARKAARAAKEIEARNRQVKIAAICFFLGTFISLAWRFIP